MKVRALGLTQYDAILLLDSDVAVVGDLSPLFSLPTEFAAVWDQPKLLGRWAGAGWGQLGPAGVARGACGGEGARAAQLLAAGSWAQHWLLATCGRHAAGVNPALPSLPPVLPAHAGGAPTSKASTAA